MADDQLVQSHDKLRALTPPNETGEEGIFELLVHLGSYRRLILLYPLVIAAMAAVVSLLMPSQYTAVARVIPPQQGPGATAALLNQLGSFATIAGASLGLKNSSDLFVGMLQGDTVADALIDKFQLMSYYKVSYRDDARKQLRNHSRINANSKSGIISIEVETRDAQFSARLANGFVDELHAVINTLAMTEAGQRRVFFEHQLEQTKQRLTDAEIALRQAIGTGGLVSMDVLGRATVEGAARLRALISAKEIEIGAMRAYATANNPEMRRAETELDSLRQQLAQMESGAASIPHSEQTPSQQVPKGMDNLKLFRDVKYNEALYDIVAKQYELARVEESREAPLLQVLDRAKAPDRRSSPKRTLIVVISYAVAMVLFVSLALLRHRRSHSHNVPGARTQLSALREAWFPHARP